MSTVMEQTAIEQKIMIGDKEVTLTTGEMARAADGAVMVQCGETVIMVTAVGSKEPRPGIDFFPLLIDYEEKMYAVGRLPGGFIKREGRPSESAVLTCRLIDRPIRPLWPDGYRKDVQVVARPLSVDSVNQPDVLAILGASVALTLSGLPFSGPIGAVRVAHLNDQFVVNPTYEETAASRLDLVVAGTADSIMMVEAGASFVSEQLLLEALAFAQGEIAKQVEAQLELAKKAGVEKQTFVPDLDVTPLQTLVKEKTHAAVVEAYHDFDRDSRKEKLETVRTQLNEHIDSLAEGDPIRELIESTELNILGEAFKKVEKMVMRDIVLSENVRADGRKPEDIRPITCKVGFLPRVHGSALFTRGNTQVLGICTLGASGDAQSLDGVEPLTKKRWMHHYSFPGYSVGEVKPMRGAGRREIGHGALAERAVLASLPEEDEFPYALRVNSEVLESNGSTSMASTCAASLSLMDAGVPVNSPIGGIAMGLIKEGDQYKVLSDIQGVEDFLGDMDFKVTGNSEGITALQMDIKIQGISVAIMEEALEQARVGRLHILSKMAEAISEPRDDVSKYAPRVVMLRIDPDDIGGVIGPGGKMIRSIIDETSAAIDIDDDGRVIITGEVDGCNRAREIIEQLTMKVQPGMVLEGKVVRILPVGAIVEFAPGKDGMVHISQLADRRVEKVEDVVRMGQQVVVKVQHIDDRGRNSLTIKGVTPEEKARFGNGVPATE